MKLNDLVEALATEVERAQPSLVGFIDQLATLEADDEAFVDALDAYLGQAQRMGEAADMAGFPGLGRVCAHVVENAMMAAVLPVDERGPLMEFLRRWPLLIVHYLRNLSDPSMAAGLVDHLVQAPNPLGEDQALKIAHMLGAMEGFTQTHFTDEEKTRPVLAAPEDVALDIPEDADHKLLEGFFTEAPGQARYLVELARNMVSGEGDSSDLVAAKRVLHTLKGSGSIIGLRGLASLGHHLEDILDHFERSGSNVAKPVADALLDAAFCLEQMIDYLLGNDEFPQQAQGVLQNVLDLANRIDRGESVDKHAARNVRAAPSPDGDHAGSPASAGGATFTAAPSAALRVGVDRIDELFRVSGEISVHTSAMEARLKALSEGASALLAQHLRVQKRLFELETVVDVRALTVLRGRGQSGAPDGMEQVGFDPLEMDQYNELHSTAHALMEEVADAQALANRLEEGIATTAGVQIKQQQLAKDLQHLVIGTRMAEAGMLTSRLQRNVRSTCQSTGKQADLVIEGGQTLIDSDVINRLAEPLLHILRNAVDHGIEAPHERAAAGKSETGRIELSFARQGQQVVLRCRDDGRGLDYEAIRKRAIERELLTADQEVSEDELARVILMPGFSTRDTVNELSGRGVGLDVVHEWAVSMNGSIRLSSRPGEGSEIELRFAASLSTMQSLIVEASGQYFALPSVQVERAIPPGIGRFEPVADGISFYYSDAGKEKVCRLDPLAALAGLPRAPNAKMEDYGVVLVRIDERTRALAVDRLVDARELLVKKPGRYARHLSGVAGLSILGDGSVAVNLDLAQLLSGKVRVRAVQTGDAEEEVVAGAEPPCVLIVDDALSVRNALLEMARDAGYRAHAARDGMEAAHLLGELKPDIVLTDLEMPNMNGIELTAHIRNNPDMNHLPVIMITSRSQEKHRLKAEEVGVNTYFTKPYNDVELLSSMRTALEA